MISFCVDAGHPINDGLPDGFRNVDAFGVARRKRQSLDGLQQRERHGRGRIQNRREESTVRTPNDGAGFDGTAQLAVADGVQDGIGEFPGVAHGVE